MFISFHYGSRLVACYCTIVRHPLLAFSGGFTSGYLFFGKRCTLQRCTYSRCGRLAQYGGGGYAR